jgi:phosphoribosylformylglycinamidine cyclo-ligase
LMQKIGNVETHEMFRTFNMGVGMVVVCDAKDKEFLLGNLEGCVEIGKVVEGNKEVEIV